jgi:antirestriction protein ArdC
MVGLIQVVDPNNIVPRADKTDVDARYYTRVGPGRSTSDPATPRQLEYIKERLDSGTLPVNLEQGAKRFLDTNQGQPLKSHTSDFVGALKKHEAELKDQGLDQDAPSTPDLSKFKTVDKQVSFLEVGDLVPKTFLTSKAAQSAVAEEREKDPKFELPPLEEVVGHKASDGYMETVIVLKNLETGETRDYTVRGTTVLVDVRVPIDSNAPGNDSPRLIAGELPGLDQDAAAIDRINKVLAKYRPEPAASDAVRPSVAEGAPGSKANPLKLTDEQYEEKAAQLSLANATASAKVFSGISDILGNEVKVRKWARKWNRDATRPIPVNPGTGSYYKGPNLLALENAASEKGFSDPRWFTTEQVKNFGGSIPAGVEGTQILVPTVLVSEYRGRVGELYEFKEITVFNGDQIEGIPSYNKDDDKSYTAEEAVKILLDRLRAAAEIRGTGKPDIFGVQLREGENPRWMPNYENFEKLRLPLRTNFDSDEEWFSTLAHELIHSTGHKDRIDRKELSKAFAGDKSARAEEEMTAELGAMILSRMFGIGSDFENSAFYVGNHLTRVNKADQNSAIGKAAARAQLAVDYLLGNDVLPQWSPTKTKVFPTVQSERLDVTTPKASSLNPDPTPDLVDAPMMGFDQDAGEEPVDKAKSVSSSKDAKEKVLSSLLNKIKEGGTPWRKPFKEGSNFAGADLPRNPASKHIYNGINAMVLRLNQQLSGYDDPRWMTYKQAQDLGGNVRKGEKGVPILIPFKQVRKEKDDKTGQEVVTGSFIRFGTGTVFNVAQIDGITLPTAKEEAGEPKTPLEAQEFILDRYKKSMEAKGLKIPEVEYTYVGEYGSHAASPNWSPSLDKITLPTKEQFNSQEDMFDTIAHELAHSTGHKDRLDRTALTSRYGSDNAARGEEELIAEISAAILASMFGVNSNFDNTAAYVKSWLAALKNNPDMVTASSSEAQKVVDYILGMDLGDWSPIEGYKSTVTKKDGESDE